MSKQVHTSTPLQLAPFTHALARDSPYTAASATAHIAELDAAFSVVGAFYPLRELLRLRSCPLLPGTWQPCIFFHQFVSPTVRHHGQVPQRCLRRDRYLHPRPYPRLVVDPNFRRVRSPLHSVHPQAPLCGWPRPLQPGMLIESVPHREFPRFFADSNTLTSRGSRSVATCGPPSLVAQEPSPSLLKLMAQVLRHTAPRVDQNAR